MCHLEIHFGVVPLISERFLEFAFGAEKSTMQRQLFRRGKHVVITWSFILQGARFLGIVAMHNCFTKNPTKY